MCNDVYNNVKCVVVVVFMLLLCVSSSILLIINYLLHDVNVVVVVLLFIIIIIYNFARIHVTTLHFNSMRSTIQFSRVQRNQKPRCVTLSRAEMVSVLSLYARVVVAGENRDDNGSGGKKDREGANKVLDARRSS